MKEKLTINDKHELYNMYLSPCSSCRNKFDLFSFTCLAFPKGIPNDILEGKNKHEKPLSGQGNTIVFLPKD